MVDPRDCVNLVVRGIEYLCVGCGNIVGFRVGLMIDMVYGRVFSPHCIYPRERILCRDWSCVNDECSRRRASEAMRIYNSVHREGDIDFSRLPIATHMLCFGNNQLLPTCDTIVCQVRIETQLVRFSIPGKF